jgi:hypothetical protein
MRFLGWAAIVVTLGAGAAACGDEGDPVIPAGSAAGATEPATPDENASPPTSAGSGAAPAQETPPASPPAASDYDKEKTWAEAHGVTIPAGRTVVIGKRRSGANRTDVYQDEIVVLRPDKTIARFVASTKPAQMPNPAGTVPDVNKDGRRDLGVVRPGIYEARGNEDFGLPGFERDAFRVYTTDGKTALPAWRDTSGDGVFSAAEKKASETQGHGITGILIHYGFAPNGTKLGGETYVGPWSVGCQNIMYAELDSFVAAVGGKSATFTYAIVDE